MLGNYTIDSGKINYIGNKIRKTQSDIASHAFPALDTKELLQGLGTDGHYKHLHAIDDAVHRAAVEYFHDIDASWCNLPLTTMMISSPGEVYAGKQLDYTTDALPVTLDWFDQGNIFLSESS